MKNQWARSGALVVSLLFIAVPALGVDGPYPGKSWERLTAPDKLGWSADKLKAARDYAGTIQTAATMVVVNGRVLEEWGETATRFKLHSIRKSLLSALYGIHVAAGSIKLAATLEELGIDDVERLTAVEKKATVGDLLKFRSGVYHSVSFEPDSRTWIRPPRGSHAPGTFWYYNNWDANILGAIFEGRTKADLFPEFKARIADPIGMEDFRVGDGEYANGPDSRHPWFFFNMTARDLARFGLLFLREGAWRGQQIIPKNWVKESTTSYSDTGPYGGYGYMWWVAVNGKFLPSVRLPDGSYAAWGSGGHFLVIVPPLDLVIVHRVNTDIRGRRVSRREFGKLVRLILEAKTPAAP